MSSLSVVATTVSSWQSVAVLVFSFFAFATKASDTILPFHFDDIDRTNNKLGL
jgi:hypothetical protein